MLISQDNFVKPYFISQLGGLGLTAADIAKSLEIPAKRVREKLREGFFDRIKAQGFQGVAFSTPNETNGLETQELALCVGGAKFFVGKYNSPIADAYLAYLINLDRKQEVVDKLCRENPLFRLSEDFRDSQIKQALQGMRIDALEGSVKELSNKVDELCEHDDRRTVKAYCKRHNIRLPKNTLYNSIGRRASKIMRDQGKAGEIGKHDHPDLDQINKYPVEFIKQAIIEVTSEKGIDSVFFRSDVE